MADALTPSSPTAKPSPTVKQRVQRALPGPVLRVADRAVFRARRARIRGAQRAFGALGFNVVKRADYYSTLPVLSEIESSRHRWDRPSELVGIDADPQRLAANLTGLLERWNDEFDRETGDYLANTRRGFGPGYPQLDARVLYAMLREHRPRRYLEVGSGLSTYYASLAAERNAADGSSLALTCVEPYPFDALRGLDVRLVEGFVQDVPLEVFGELEAGDVLFIDSSHALKIDSDVAYLFLEVLPRVAPGVIVHIHDVHFPFNTPYPADTWLFGERWPVYWNEAMVVQTFLTFNAAFEVTLSAPIVRHHDESVLERAVPGYTPLAQDPNPPSSLWIRRTP